jgi:Glycosyltransferase 61
MHADAAAKDSVEWLRFRRLIAGRGQALESTWRRLSTPTMSFLCSPVAWRAMRAHAYAAASLPLRAAADLEGPRVVILGGNPASGVPDVRQILNERALVASLRVRLPGVDIDVVEMGDLSVAQQLEEISRTTVLVSTLGSKSFRMVMLPDGAQARSQTFRAEGKKWNFCSGPPFGC